MSGSRLAKQLLKIHSSTPKLALKKLNFVHKTPIQLSRTHICYKLHLYTAIIAYNFLSPPPLPKLPIPKTI